MQILFMIAYAAIAVYSAIVAGRCRETTLVIMLASTFWPLTLIAYASIFSYWAVSLACMVIADYFAELVNRDGNRR